MHNHAPTLLLHDDDDGDDDDGDDDDDKDDNIAENLAVADREALQWSPGECSWS